MLSAARLQSLQSCLSFPLSTSADDLVHYGQDWTRYQRPDPCAIAFPQNEAEVVALVAWARREGIALVPSGGRTGLSGAAVAAGQELVISFDRMNAILELDKVGRTVRCQPGVVTRVLQQYAQDHDLYYPVDFASSGSSQIGGNVATNAGGIKVVRYGMTRNWVAGLRVVTGAGEVLSLNKGLAKNNAGYDLRQLMIGSEGTLGLITEVTLSLTTPPPPTAVFLLAIDKLADIMSVFHRFAATSELFAFEFFSHQAMQYVLHKDQRRAPFDEAANYYVLLEARADSEEAMAALEALCEAVLEKGWAADAIMASSLEQAAALWRLREGISEAITPYSPYKNDVSVRVSRVPAFIDSLSAMLRLHYPSFEVLWYGHIGDGNVHINILKAAEMDLVAFREQCERVNGFVFALVEEFEGSMSAEHGVGVLKRDYLGVTRSEPEILLMRQLKNIFDPDGILNPGKIFPAARLP